MSTKLPRSLPDEKTDMQKQLGCMNGIFQLFDRHNFLPGRRATGHNHKRLPPGTGQNVIHGMEQNGTMDKMQVRKEKKVAAPDELSRTSISSSCSSSTFSSVNCSKTAQSEPSSSCQSSFPETTSLALPLKQPSSPSQLSRQSLDLRDIVKDSMYKEARVLSVKTKAKEEGRGHTIKHIDSPRPLQQHKHVQPEVMRHEGSLRVLAKLRDGPWNAKEEKYGSLPFAPRDSPRYSYDERESQDKLKSTAKLKELPRLSLDSRERSRRNSACELKSNHLSREIERETRISSQILNQNQEPGSNKRPSTIVARLMGLEPIPGFFPTDEGQMMKMKSCLDEDADMISRSTRVHDESSRNKVPGSPKVSCKNPASPRLRNDNSVKKSTSRSIFPLEPAPWRQTVGNRGSQRQELKYREASNKSPHASPSVYGKRLTELEFKKSGKDLRALKQILKAMEKTRERLENKKEEQTPTSESHTSKFSTYTSFDEAYTQQRPSNNPVSPIIKGSSSPQKCGSQFVIMKPAKLIGKPVIPTDGKSGLHKMWSGDNADNTKDLLNRQTTKDITPRKNHPTESSGWHQPVRNKKINAESTLRSSRYPKVPQQMSGENPASFQRSSRALSPRLQEKKHGMEKLSSLSTQLSDLRRARDQSIKQPTELGSPRRKLKPKSTNLQHGNEQISCSTSEARTLSHQRDTLSMQSERGISLASQIGTEVKSTDHTKEITSPYRPKDPTEEDFTARFTEDRLIAELAIKATLEQPSPVSVLDTTFYDEEDSPSPVKKISTAFQDYETLNSDEAEWNAVYIDNLKNSRRTTNLSSKFDHRKLENINHLVHKLRLVNSSKDEATTNCIESLCDNTNPDHRYIVNILLAAGLLVDLGSSLTTIQLHPSGISVHPNLFHFLEKAMATTELADEHHARSKPSKKVQRKLLFDAVNEILAHKSLLEGSVEPWIFQNKMGEKSRSGEKLLKELCSKMDHQQATPDASLNDEDDGLTSILRADMMNQPENLTDYSSELPGIVLDIERLIFKDLIGEVMRL